MISCKSSVRFSTLRREVWSLFPIIEEIWTRAGQHPTVTCGTEAHELDDPHTNGYAIDLRSKDIQSGILKQQMLHELIELTGPNYTVLLENEGLSNEHFHIQIKKGLWRTLLRDS